MCHRCLDTADSTFHFGRDVLGYLTLLTSLTSLLFLHTPPLLTSLVPLWIASYSLPHVSSLSTDILSLQEIRL